MSVDAEGGWVEVRLPYRAPCDVEGLIGYLARRAVPGVEEMVDGAYRRSLRLPHGHGVVEVRSGREQVRARYWLSDSRDLDTAVERSRTLMDLDSDPVAVTDALGDDELIGPLVRAAPGRRVPGHVDEHELAMRAVLGQQVALRSAATLAGRLVAASGDPLERPVATVTHAFPTAAQIAETDAERFAMPESRRRALLALARALATRAVVLEPGVDPQEARERLLALPGIGPWTTEYIAMRALRDPDAFLASDLGVRRALERFGHDGRPINAARLSEHWRPYRAYALQYLWASLSPGRDGAQPA
ncbi:MAG: DNA-3-methyladenine glycosylase 2 family protein, partial [Solirubrobacterales bacterium]|nr:DNA-3-methyladenine glycosylase 2 family protein [Solirubrobacterales bacterium]